VLILVAHDEANGTARGFTLEDTAEQFHTVGLVACRRDIALTRAATV
jgi:hypothetical protein